LHNAVLLLQQQRQQLVVVVEMEEAVMAVRTVGWLSSGGAWCSG
jgi:hypothetical protein